MKSLTCAALSTCFVCLAGCSDDGGIIGPDGTAQERRALLRDQRDQRHRESRRPRRRRRRCQSLAAGAGLGAKTWRAYLSVERDASNGGQPTNARDRIGVGPWTNVNGVIVAETLADLHARTRRCAIFRRRARHAHQRPVDGIAGAGAARHPHRIERRRHADARRHLRRLDVGLGRVLRAGRSLRRPRARRRARRVRCPRGTPRTRIRIARTRRRAAEQAGCTASR